MISPSLAKARKKSNRFLTKNKFAAKVVALEMRLEIESATMKDVYNLIALYSEAIDFYANAQSDNLVYFKLKLQKLLVTPRIAKMILELEELKQKLGLKTSKKILSKIVSGKPNINTICQKLNYDNYKKEAITQKSRTMMVEQKVIVKKHQFMSNQNDKTVEKDLGRQKDRFRERIERRRENSRSRSRRGLSIGSNKGRGLSSRRLKRNNSNVSLGIAAIGDEDIFKTENLLDEYGGVLSRK